MAEETIAPVTAPAEAKSKSPFNDRPTAFWFSMGGLAGLTVGIFLTIGAFTIYTLVVHSLPTTQHSVQVFHELNDLRRQLNQINEEKKNRDQEEQTLRQALSAVTSTARVSDVPVTGTTVTAKKETPRATPTPTPKARGPFAEIDAEIERLEQTQKVLNTILDLFPAKGKESENGR